jgi:predicted aminopeptidase
VFTRGRLIFLTIAVTTATLLSAGASSVRYLLQAGRGQYAILRATRPIGEAIRDETMPAPTRRLLAAVKTIKAFGQAQGLEPTASYERYADLHRPAAAWIVQACAPLSFDMKRWRFPLVGSVPYLGFFEEAAARSYARSLSAGGVLDVDVRPASAFSTLGWFPDPVLSTMLRSGEGALGALANVVLHESVHATVYVKDQSAFNESLASFVADRLTAAWLVSALGSDAPETSAWTTAQARERAFVARMHDAYLELDALYRSGAGEDAKRSEKARILTAVSTELELARRPNNAVLAGYRTYDSGGPAFERLLKVCGESWPRMLRVAATLAGSDFSRPQQDEFDSVVDRLAGRCETTATTQGVASSL